MPNNASGASNVTGWTAILNSVQTPLGFFTLLALVLDAVLLATAAVTERVSFLAPIAVLALLLICVFAIVLAKPLALYHPKDWPAPIMINLVFPQGTLPVDVDLDLTKSTLEVRDQGNGARRIINPNLSFGPGGWSCQLERSDIAATSTVSLELIDVSGKKWAVRPFLPYTREAGALPRA